MISYELAKELKNAGFPNIRIGDYFEHRVGSHSDDYGGDSDYPCYCNQDKLPTLSELIEACGEDFVSLERFNGGGFVANGCRDYDDDYTKKKGKTPEEAVARLWLALNKAS